MKLTSTATYLSLILETLESKMIPDLQSDNVRNDAAFAVSMIKELLRREHEYPAALAAINSAGLAIATDMQMALGMKKGGSMLEGNGDPINCFGQLCETISGLGESLCRSNTNEPIRATLLRRAAEWEYESHTQLLNLEHESAISEATPIEPLSKQALEDFIQSVHPDGQKAQLVKFDRLPGGFGKQTSLITVQDASGKKQQLIVRKCDRMPTSLHKSFDLEREFHLVAAVSRTGFPAPKPLWMGNNVPGSDAPFYVMERLPGKPPGSFVDSAKLPESFVLEWAELLAQLHAIPLESMADVICKYDAPGVLNESVEQAYRRQVADIRAYAEQTKPLPSPTLIHLFDWLQHNVPRDNSRPVLTHGDFGVHNMLAADGHVTAVVDWEIASFGSPLKDLAYVKPFVEKHMDWSRFLARYVERSGREIDTSALPYYHAFAAMWGLLSLNRGTRLVQEGKIREARFTFFELGVNPMFMKMGIDGSANPFIVDTCQASPANIH